MSDFYFNGKFLGSVENPDDFVKQVINERRKGTIDKGVNVYINSKTKDIKLDSTVGRIRRPLAFYRILEFFAKMKKQQCAKLNLQPHEPLSLDMRLQAHNSNKIYFVPIDYVQKTITDLFFLEPSNKTYHVTGKNPGSLSDIADISRDLLKISGLDIVEKTKHLTIKEKLVNKFLGDLMPYFSTEIIFDTKNVEEALGEEALNWKVDYDALYIVIKAYFMNMFPEIIGPE